MARCPCLKWGRLLARIEEHEPRRLCRTCDIHERHALLPKRLAQP